MTGAGRALALGALLLSACLGPADFRCQTHGQCGSGATCEVDGHCSVADAKCASGRRYVSEAGALADRCVGDSCPGNSIRAIAAGQSHACVLRADGGVWCWGRNDEGQLGDGSRTPRSLAVRVPGLVATAVAAGDRHTCAVRTDGAVLCWGADDTGALGDGGGSGRRTPVAVEGIAGAVAVAAGAGFSCAVLNDGTARCWGDDGQGQLGDAAPAPATAIRPVAVFALSGIRALVASWQHACALRDDETLWCWGANGTGQVGDGTAGGFQPQPVRVQPLTGVTHVATGVAHTCAATRAAGLFCWGANGTGQLGSAGGASQPRPVVVPTVADPVAVATGAQHTCAIRQSGAILCWGANTAGQLGDGTMRSLPIPATVTGLGAGVAIAAGAVFSCAETGDGAVFCWGDNHYGQLAVGTATVRPVPNPVTLPGGARAVAAGGAHTCVAADDGHVSCWGANQAGQLGDDGLDNATPAPTRVPVEDAVGVAAGDTHTCARTGAGALACWGRGGSGQLGPGPEIDNPFPTAVDLGGANVVSATAGGAHTCAALSDGTARCWGANGDGQLGDGTTTGRAVPASVTEGGGAAGAPLASVVEVAAGSAHTCARLGDGGVRCWGRGGDGQLGDGAATSAALPVTAPLMTGGGTTATASSVTAGGAHTCALDAEGRAWCWGRGDAGQLGLGSTDGAAAPTPVKDLPGVASVAAGGSHTCAVASDGTVWCWGANDDGQLGLGDTDADPHPAPAPVSGLSHAVRVSAGAAHTCAWRADRSVWCWGGNFAGQLGDGVMLTHSGPLLARLACGQ